MGEEMPKPFGNGLVRGGLYQVLGHSFALRNTCWWSSGYCKDLLRIRHRTREPELGTKQSKLNLAHKWVHGLTCTIVILLIATNCS